MPAGQILQAGLTDCVVRRSVNLARGVELGLRHSVVNPLAVHEPGIPTQGAFFDPGVRVPLAVLAAREPVHEPQPWATASPSGLRAPAR